MEETKKPEPVKDRLAKWIAGGIIRCQLRISSKLGKVERRLSMRAKKVLLVIFCLLFGSYCGIVLVRAVLPRPPEEAGYIKKATGADQLPEVRKMPGYKPGDTINHKK